MSHAACQMRFPAASPSPTPRRENENCRIFLEFCGAAFSQGYAVTGRAGESGESVLAAAFGACHCPRAIFCCSPFVSRNASTWLGSRRGTPEPVQILFSLLSFFWSSSKPLIYAALGRFWFSDDSWMELRSTIASNCGVGGCWEKSAGKARL